MRVFYQNGVIMEGPRSAVKRAIQINKKYWGYIPYRFSRPWPPEEWI